MVSEQRTIDVRLLRVFLTTARYGSVTAASDALGIAKSAVSKQLSALEKLLQVRLFERASRRIALTGEGRLLLPRAESILAELDQFVTDAQEHVSQVRGTVRIAASPEFGAFLSRHFIPALLGRHASLKVAMTLEYRFDDLHDPGVDLAFRLGALRDDRLVARSLGEFARVLVCGADYAQRTVLETPGDLESANALLFSDSELTEEWLLERVDAPGDRERANVSGNVSVRGFDALAGAALAGLGIARLPLFVAARGLADGSLVRVLPQWRPPSVPVHLVYRAGISRVGRVRAAIDTAMDVVPGLLATMSATEDMR